MTDNSNKPIQFGIRSKNVLCFANGSNFFIVFQSFSPVEVASMPKVAALDEKSPPRHHECMLTSAVFIEQDEQLLGKHVPTYLRCTAQPSKRPPRLFCSVCGQHSKYTCTRCGSRSCSIACQQTHKDTRCLKWIV
mmetsp:Transcript_4499/g.6756  ORF Transcript_4499/g.6756 Transcript_4499/m.6756 type:complete len:135 (-) Transcript_4499:31-435(-)